MERDEDDEQRRENGAQQPSRPSPAATAATTRMRELSTDQQSAWVEKLFAKFAAIYGRTFADLWEGIHPYEVKREWCDSLAPFTGAQIAWAIEACKRDSDIAPTLPRFLRMCSQAPRPSAPMIAEGTTPMPADVKGMLEATLQRTMEKRLDLRASWAIEVLRRVAQGAHVPPKVEQFGVEGLVHLGAVHLAPAEYVQLNRPAWKRLVLKEAA